MYAVAFAIKSASVVAIFILSRCLLSLTMHVAANSTAIGSVE